MFFVQKAIPQKHLNREIAHRFLLALCPCIYYHWNHVKIYIQHHLGWKRRRNSGCHIDGYMRRKVSPPSASAAGRALRSPASASSYPTMSHAPLEHMLHVPDFRCRWGHLIALGVTYILFWFKSSVSLKKVPFGHSETKQFILLDVVQICLGGKRKQYLFVK